MLKVRSDLELENRHHHNQSYFYNKELVLAKCQNPGYLRSKIIRDLVADQIQCFTVTVETINEDTYLLNCKIDNTISKILASPAINIEWLYK